MLNAIFRTLHIDKLAQLYPFPLVYILSTSPSTQFHRLFYFGSWSGALVCFLLAFVYLPFFSPLFTSFFTSQVQTTKIYPTTNANAGIKNKIVYASTFPPLTFFFYCFFLRLSLPFFFLLHYKCSTLFFIFPKY